MRGTDNTSSPLKSPTLAAAIEHHLAHPRPPPHLRTPRPPQGGFADRVRAMALGNYPSRRAEGVGCGTATLQWRYCVRSVAAVRCETDGPRWRRGHRRARPCAIKFAAAWGCEVTAFTSSSNKTNEARAFGAHHVVSSRDPRQLAAIAGTLDLVLVTMNVPLDWKALIATLRPKGRLHFVGAVL
jgi:Zinc-binding dehydrogenase